MPKATLDLDAEVLLELRHRARLHRKSVGQVASELLALALVQCELGESRPFSWIARDLGKPLIDLEDTDAVRADLDERR